MSRSSIFNFESVRSLRPQMPAALLAAVGVIAVLEIGLRLTPDPWLYPSSKSRQGIVTFFEQEVIPHFKNPRIIIMGTSRAMDGIRPAMLDGLLGLPKDATLNLGLQGGRPFDALRLYRRNRERLGFHVPNPQQGKENEKKLVLLFLDEWHFSSGWGLGARFALHAPLKERFGLTSATTLPDLPRPPHITPSEWERRIQKRKADKQQKLERLRTILLTDQVFNMRLKLRYVLPALGLNLGLATTREMVLNEENQVIRPEHKRLKPYGRVIKNPRSLHNRIHGFYRDFDSHPILIDHVRKLATLVQADGARLVLIQMPNRGQHQFAVETLYGPHYAQHIKTTETLARELKIPFYLYRMPADCGLEERHFYDYGHLALKGSETFTQFIAELIRKEGLLDREMSVNASGP